MRGPIFAVGAIGLLTVMAVDTIAVLGRHLGMPLLGAIEIIQAAILISACAATVIATINQAHAAVHLVTDRLGPRAKHALSVIAAVLATLFFVGLCLGVVWLAMDFWSAREESELLHIPYRPLRALAALTIASVAALFAYQALRRARSST